jgi:hypothetical protein
VGCLRRIVLALLLLGAGWVGWRWGGSVFPELESTVAGWVAGIQERGGDQGEPDAAMGDEVALRLERFLSGQEGDSLVLQGVEVSSVLEFSTGGLLPPGFDRPRIRFEDGVAVLSLRAAMSRLPSFPELEGFMEVLPDTVPLELRGRIQAFPGGTSMKVESIEAARIPLPRRMYPSILEALGRRDQPGLPPEAVEVPLPRGVQGVYIPGDRLVLLGRR